jgi:hypothetical protein
MIPQHPHKGFFFLTPQEPRFSKSMAHSMTDGTAKQAVKEKSFFLFNCLYSFLGRPLEGADGISSQKAG